MAGLLNAMQSDQGMLGLALLSAAAPTMEPTNFAGRLGSAMSNLQGMQQAQQRKGLLDAQMQAFRARADEQQSEIAQRRAEAERRARIQAALPGLFGMSGATPGMGATGAVNDALPPQFQIGAQPALPGAQVGTPQGGGFNVRRALEIGMTPDEIAKYAGLQDVGRPKATRQLEVDDGRGGKRIALVDDFGREVGGFAGYVAPVQVNQGDRVTFVRPSAGVALPVGMSPAERDASARGWASQNLARERFNLESGNATAEAGGPSQVAFTRQFGKAAPGYRWKADGTQEVIPGGPADAKNSAEGQKRVTEAKDVLGLLNEVDRLLPNSTGSYIGAGVDQAARAFGVATQGAEVTAQLKAIEGALISKMPKMSGPQSDKDVLLYRQMAGQVADPTLPVSVRQKAADTIRRLNEQYAGMPQGSSKAPSVVKTGMYGGRKVEQLSDGTVRYAD